MAGCGNVPTGDDDDGDDDPQQAYILKSTLCSAFT